jgi:hypothetical protein
MDKTTALIGMVRSGRFGQELKLKWLAFLASKKNKNITPSSIPAVIEPSIQPSVETPAETPAETVPSVLPPLPGITGGPLDLDTIRLASPEVDIQNLNPDLKARLAFLASGYQQMTGDKLQINSGSRTYAHQARLHATNKYAAHPDRSPHVDRGGGGNAFDAQSDQLNRARELGLLEAAGLDTPVRNEPWHVQVSKNAPPLLAGVAPEATNAPVPSVQPSATNSPTIVNNNNIVPPVDLRWQQDDPALRYNNHNGV